MNKNKLRLALILSALITSVFHLSCDKTPPISDWMMDSSATQDSSITNPEAFLTSALYADSNSVPTEKKVLMQIHGFGASTFEWWEFKDWSDSTQQPYLSSVVLLGGHGRDFETFKKSSWRDWQSGITDEYEALVDLGFDKISMACSSTGCPLILNLISEGYFDENPPEEILMIDPIIFSSIKVLSLVDYIKFMVPYTEAEKGEDEAPYWYNFRPSDGLQELQNLITRVRKQLEDGMKLPPGTKLKVWKAKVDDGADPLSILAIYKGVKTATGAKIDAEVVDSDVHVFTRLKYREGVTQKDYDLQLKTFEEIAERVVNY